ncbi:MAG: hypothetical protein ACI91B_004628 [Planctomycetota bacterium]
MKRRACLVWLTLALILTGHLWFHGTWIVDDAGITFAFARNFAAGHGWVTWPGTAPIEGFSNLLWALLLLPFFWLDAFDPVYTAKLLGAGCAFATLIVLRSTLRQTHPQQQAYGDVGLCLLACTPTFSIWSLSGLENGLYGLLVAILLWLSARSGTRRPTTRTAICAGTVAVLAAITRPEGAVLAALWPLTTLCRNQVPWRRRLVLVSIASAVTIMALLAVTLWRWQIFGDIVPNTFHAKVHSGTPRFVIAAALTIGLLLILGWHARSRQATWRNTLLVAAAVFGLLLLVGGSSPARAVGGDIGFAITAVAFALACHRRAVASIPWAIATTLAIGMHAALPRDWMGEHRFATPFVVVLVPWLVVEFAALRQLAAPRTRAISGVALAAVLLFLVARNAISITRFANEPTTPLASVAQRHLVLAAWAQQLAVADVSALVPDVGGPLWLAKLRIIDLYGLCDANIAKLLGDPDRLADHILNDRKPTFIEFHGDAAQLSGLPRSPMFRRDYLPILESAAGTEPPSLDRPATSGVYVRREYAPPPSVLAAWRRQWR